MHEGSDPVPSEPQGTVERIAGRPHQMRPRRAGEPRLDAGGEAAHQGQSGRSVLGEACGDGVDMAGREPHDLARSEVLARGMVEDQRRQAPEVAGARGAHPGHDGVGIGAEPLRHLRQQRRPCGASIVRPQRATHRLPADPGAGAFVRHREAPAAHARAPPAADGPTYAARADDDYAAVPAAVSAYARRMGIRGDLDAVEERLEGRLCRSGLLGLAGAGQCQTSDNQVAERRAGLRQALAGGVAHRPHAFLKTDPDIGRPCDALAQDGAGRIRKARTAAGAAAVNPKKK